MKRSTLILVVLGVSGCDVNVCPPAEESKGPHNQVVTVVPTSAAVPTSESWRNYKKPEAAWYFIAGNSEFEEGAKLIAQGMGPEWHILPKDVCPNFTKGWWTVVKGPFPTADIAKSFGSETRGYVKACGIL